MSARAATAASVRPVRYTATVAADLEGLTEVMSVSLSAGEQRTLSRVAYELAGSAPKLASLLSLFNRLTSGEEMPERWQKAGKTGKCERQRPRRSRRWRTRRVSHAGQRAWPVIIALTLIGVAVIVVALVLSHTGHEAGGNGRCMQSWPIVCQGSRR